MFGEDNDEVVVAYLTKISETDKAILFEIDDGIQEWFPKSKITIDTDMKEISCPKWLAEEKGVDYDYA